MPRGMNRTTILSHGLNHDAQGVGGTHVKGTIPAAAVLDAIPLSVGTVGNLPERALPGSGPAKDVKGPQVRTRRFFDDEGNPDFPPEIKGRGALSTERPSIKVTTAEKVAEQAERAKPTTILPPPDMPPDAETSAAPVTPSDDVNDTPVTGTPQPDLDLSKRKLTRATVEQLREWCMLAGINPAEYVDEGQEVTGKLMREILAQRFTIDL